MRSLGGERLYLLATGSMAGMFAGLIFVVSEMVLSVLLGLSVAAPVRLISSVLLGPAAISAAFPIILVAAAFVAVHLSLSAVFGVVFVLLLSSSRRLIDSPAVVLCSSVVYGTLIWSVNSLALAPRAWAQFLVVDQFWQGVVPHALFFGLPLALYLMWSKRRGIATDGDGTW